jgi:hypothetical protein
MSPLSEGSLRDESPAIAGQLNYLAPGNDAPQVRIYPPSSGLATAQPALAKHTVPIRDARPIADHLSLDKHGFELHARRTAFVDFYDEAAVRAHYYPDVEALMQELTNALTVIAFDHNVRSVVRAARGDRGVRAPVDQVHNDYTEDSGPRRGREILEAAGRADLADRHLAFVNLWRPIVGPVLDNPLALCDARSVGPTDLVATEILHFGDDDLVEPRHRGAVQSVRYNQEHRWFYVSAMRPEEFLLLKCYDSRTDGRARFVPHTGFDSPARPREFVPRESIETRTLVVLKAPTTSPRAKQADERNTPGPLL